MPRADVAATLVYQAQGFEVETVVRDGELVMEDRTVFGAGERYPDLRDRAARTATDVVDRAGLPTPDTEWQSVSTT